jgi:hypothetical protein
MRGFFVTMVLTLMAALTLAVASPASADQLADNDPKGDVYVPGDSPESQNPDPKGPKANTDVRRSVVRHDAGAVVLKVRYSDLVRKRSDLVEYHLRLRVPGTQVFDVRLRAFGDLGQGSVAITKNGVKNVRCAAASAFFAPRTERLRAVVPRACLGKPRWVRPSAQTYSIAENGISDFYDIAIPESTGKAGRLFPG